MQTEVPDGVAVHADSRMPVLDVLRGIALIGVLLVNIYDWLAKPSGVADSFVQGVVNLLFEHKSWPMLSLLFGLGFAIQIERARAKGLPVVWMHLRRMAVLCGFGIILLVLFSGNPILVRYAAAGLLLLPFAWLPTRWVLGFTVAFLLISTVDSYLYQKYIQPPRPARPQTAAQPRSQPSLAEVTMSGFKRVPQMLRNVATLGYWPGRQTEILTMFLLGLYVGKRGILLDLRAHRPMLRRIVRYVLPVGLAGTIWLMFWQFSRTDPVSVRLLRRLVSLLAGDLQSIGYVAAITLFVLTKGSRPLNLLALYGRMPLTNYLMQWLIMRLIFDRFFFGYGGKFGPAAGAWIALVIFTAQVLFSRVWLQRYMFGPAEWLWKSLTYLRRQPMRLKQSEPSIATDPAMA